MVLLLVTHTIEVPSSRVPLSAIILVDAIKRKQLPPNLKCRLVIPSSGHHSCSIWDASSVEELQAWIDINLLDGTASIAEIPEEFTYGLSLELTTARAADKVATTSKSTLERINTTGARVMESMSEKVRVKLEQLDARTNLITATRETASAAAAKVKQATNSAMENESVQRGLQSLSTSLQSAGTSMNRAFTWVGSKVKESFGAEAGAGYTGGGGVGGAQSYSGFSSEPPSYEAAAYASAPAAAAGLGGSGFMPVSTHAARSSVDQQQQQHRVAGPGPVTEDAGPMPQFTLDEGVASPMVLSPAKEAAEGHAAGHGNKEHDDAAAGGGEGGGLDAAPIVAPVGAAAT